MFLVCLDILVGESTRRIKGTFLTTYGHIDTTDNHIRECEPVTITYENWQDNPKLLGTLLEEELERNRGKVEPRVYIMNKVWTNK